MAMRNPNARRGAAGASDPMVLCDRCGTPYSASWMVLAGRYAFCKTCAPAARSFEAADRQAQLADGRYAAAVARTRAEVAADDGEYTRSARTVRAYFGFDGQTVRSSSEVCV